MRGEDGGRQSEWGNVESIVVDLPTTTSTVPPPLDILVLVGFAALVLVVLAVSVLPQKH